MLSWVTLGLGTISAVLLVVVGRPSYNFLQLLAKQHLWYRPSAEHLVPTVAIQPQNATSAAAGGGEGSETDTADARILAEGPRGHGTE
eukprot:183794-Rhodomonas_salina.1